MVVYGVVEAGILKLKYASSANRARSVGAVTRGLIAPVSIVNGMAMVLVRFEAEMRIMHARMVQRRLEHQR